MSGEIRVRPKRLLAEVLTDLTEGLPVSGGAMTAVVSEDATEAEIIEYVGRLIAADRTFGLSVRFRLGDVWNALASKPKTRLRMADAICSAYGEKFRQGLRTYGWVAAKWPADQRKDTHGWTHYLKGYPDQEAKDKFSPKEWADATGTQIKIRGGDWYCTGGTSKGKPVTMRLPQQVVQNAQVVEEERAPYEVAP